MKTFKFLQTSPFNYWSITLTWPKIKWGAVTYLEDYDASIDNARKYSVDFDSTVGYYDSDTYQSMWLIIFGFGITIAEQNGY